jgi:hypothetical protein
MCKTPKFLTCAQRPVKQEGLLVRVGSPLNFSMERCHLPSQAKLDAHHEKPSKNEGFKYCFGLFGTYRKMRKPAAREGPAKNSKNPIPTNISRISAGTTKPMEWVLIIALEVQLYPFLTVKLP